MKKLIKWSTLLLAFTMLLNVSCDKKDDDPKPKLGAGKWMLTSATLVDGNAATPDVADELVVANYPNSPIAVGDAPNTTQLVGGALAGTICTNQASYPTFYLELTNDGKLIFYCPAEEINEPSGSWTITENSDGSNTILLTVATSAGEISVNVNNVEVSDTNLTGQAFGYPMVKDLLKDLALDNLQLITTDLVFRAVPE